MTTLVLSVAADESMDVLPPCPEPQRLAPLPPGFMSSMFASCAFTGANVAIHVYQAPVTSSDAAPPSSRPRVD